MSSSRVVRGACAAVATLALAVVPAPALAQVVTNPDLAGDVSMWDGSSSDTTPAPDRSLADVTSTTLEHARFRFRGSIDFRDLAFGENQGVYVEMRTNEGKVRILTLDVNKAGTMTVDMFDGRDRDVACAVRRSVNVEANRVTFGFSRSCLSRPRWVKARVGVYAEDNSADALYLDDALRDGPLGLDDELRPSRRLYRAPAPS